MSTDGCGPRRASATVETTETSSRSSAASEWLVHDLKIAEQVQHRFLPRSLPEVPGYGFFAYYHAAYEIGGDYYDFVPMIGERLGIALGDVSGKGVAAALIMAKFSGDTRLALGNADSPSSAAAALNRALCETGIDERYITLNLSVVSLRTGRGRVCSAGHPPMLLRRADGRIEELCRDSGCLPLGILPDADYRHVEFELRPGDVAVVYSDGLTDARNAAGELFDTCETPRLRRVLERIDGGAEAVGRAILGEIGEFARGPLQSDDMTLVCFGPFGA